MAKASISLVKARKGAKPMAAGTPSGTAFNLVDNGDDTFTVVGLDKAGNQVDISSAATIAVVSDNTSILTVDPPVGMTSAMHAAGPLGTANLNITATWNDGSLGPFSFTLPVTTVAGAASGVEIQLGTPTTH
jgi:hypothetical protein